MAIATGTPAPMKPRKEPSRAGVMACAPPSQTGDSYTALHRHFGALEHAVALPPVDDEDLHRPRACECKPDQAYGVHAVHRQVDDRHPVVAHLLHHGPREV